MNPASGDFDNRAATSPALFNRCVVDWFGDWSRKALSQVGRQLTIHIDVENTPDNPIILSPQVGRSCNAAHGIPDDSEDFPADKPGLNDALVAAMVLFMKMSNHQELCLEQLRHPVHRRHEVCFSTRLH